ncbi:MAG TPA: hypothetical protein VF656_17445 [Pyrinomonadaceae bacterium]|jgi:hypothetical protein
MKLSLPKFERLHILVITLLVLLVPFSLYYWGFVRLQTTYFTEHKSRQLSVMSNQIGAKLTNLSSVVDYAATRLFESAAEARRNGKRLDASPELEVFRKTLLIGDSLEAPEFIEFTPPKRAKAKLSNKNLTFKPESGDMSKVVIDFVGEWNDGSGKQSLEVNADLSGVLQSILSKEAFDSVLIADAETGAVIHQHNRQSGLKLRIATLDALRVEEKNKEVEHQALAKATNIQDVKLAGVDYKLFSRPLEVAVTVSGSDRPGSRWIVCGLISERQFSRERLAISYTLLIIFTVLMILAAISWAFLKLWLMGAKDRLRIADVYFLGFSALIGAALLTLFSLYSYTYISLSHDADDKLEDFARLIHENLREEVRVALDELDSLNEDLLADPKSLALISESFAAKNKTTAARSASEPKTHEEKNILPQRILAEKVASRHPYPFFTTAFWIDEKRHQRIKWTTRDVVTPFFTLPTDYPFFNDIKNERFQHLKKDATNSATGKDDGTPPKTKAREQEICRQDNDKTPHHDFRLQPLISPLSGVETTVIAKRMCKPYDTWIAALDTRLLSLFDTVTPPGYGFSIIEADGRVLFHSELAQHFEENFYDETDQRAELHAAVQARQSGRISTDYLGSGHTLYTLPVQGFPEWTIITYRDKQILRTMQLELLVVAANLFLFYSLLYLLLFMGVYLWKVNMNKRAEWVWPRDESITLYRRLLLSNIVCCLLLSVAIFSCERWKLFSLAVLIPLVGLGAVGLSLWLSGRKRKGGVARSDSLRPLAHCRPWYVWMMTTMMFLISVLPAVAFFKLAHDEQMKLLAKHGQVKLAEGLRARKERVKAQYANYIRDAVAQNPPATKATKKTPAAAGEANTKWVNELISRRLIRPLDVLAGPPDVYESVLLDTERVDMATGNGRNTPPAPPPGATHNAPSPNGSTPPSYEAVLSYLRPIVNRASGEWAGLIASGSADGAWRWSETEEKRLLLQTQETDVEDHASPLQLSSDVPLFGQFLWPTQRLQSAVWWLCLAAIFALLFISLRFVIVRIFLLNLDEPMTTLYTNEFNNLASLEKRFVVLGAPFLNVRSLVDNSKFKRISMEDAALWQDTGAGQHEAALEGAALAIDNFDYRSDDPMWNLKRLQLLEKLQDRSDPVIIFSRHDPFRFCLALTCSDSMQQLNGTFPMNATDRWMNVVSSFWVTHIEDKGEWQTFKKSLDDNKGQHVSSNGHPQRRFIRFVRRHKTRSHENGNRFAAFYDALANECRPRTYLQNVGKGILKYPDLKKLSSEQLVRLVVEQAEAYYKAIWATCTSDQKLTLYYLAQDRLISAKNAEVRRLMRRGLIVRDPDVRLMNESFRQFVLSTVVPDEIGAFERTGSSWSKLRLPLLLILVGIALFLLVAHPELYTSSMAVITALATGIPAVFQLLGMFQRGKPAELAQLPGETPPHAG